MPNVFPKLNLPQYRIFKIDSQGLYVMSGMTDFTPSSNVPMRRTISIVAEKAKRRDA